MENLLDKVSNVLLNYKNAGNGGGLTCYPEMYIDFSIREINKLLPWDRPRKRVLDLTSNEQVHFYLWPIHPTFNPKDLNGILDYLIKVLSPLYPLPNLSFTSKRFEFNEKGGMLNDLIEIELQEPIAKNMILAEFQFLDSSLSVLEEKRLDYIDERILFRDISVRLFPCSELAEDAQKGKIVSCYLSEKGSLEGYKKKYLKNSLD